MVCTAANVPPLRIIAANDDRGFEFADDVGEGPVRVKRQVARAGAGRQLRPGRIGRAERAPLPVEAERHQPVRAQVNGQDEAAVGAGRHHVGMWAFLTLAIGPGAGKLHGSGCFAQAAVLLDRQNAQVAGLIVGHQAIASFRLNAGIAGRQAVGRLLVQIAQMPGCRIDGKGAHRPMRASCPP